MGIRRALWAAALVLSPSLLAAPVAAQTPGGKATSDVKQDLKDAGRAITQAFRDARDKLRQTRDDRRRDQRKDARDKWGSLLARTDVQGELRLHARRMARLDYIEKLAADVNQDKVQDRAKRARDLEKERFERRLRDLEKTGGAR